ncbi:hypothetical protein ACJIZ3_013209 [Penstemon smallii]|uniref:Uncharacterized protein n=1 Tax=Penstemon smallii TaxID=265156 RepID=A0ABD3UP74_9LAMI
MKSWPRMVPQKSMVSNVFGSRAFEQYRNDLTLLEAASRNVDGDNVFARLGTHILLEKLIKTVFKNYFLLLFVSEKILASFHFDCMILVHFN